MLGGLGGGAGQDGRSGAGRMGSEGVDGMALLNAQDATAKVVKTDPYVPPV